MSRRSKIRWRDADTKELERVINNFNQKLYRTKKNHPEIAEFQPQLMTKAQALEKIETRADYNRLINSLKRYSKRGAEKPLVSSGGAKFTEWEKNEFLQMQRIDNARKTRELKKILNTEVSIAGKGQGVTRAEMGRVKENELKETHRDPMKQSQREWELFKGVLEKRLKSNYFNKAKIYMQANYIRGLMNVGFSDELVKYMFSINPDEFYRIIETNETATFDFIYDPQELAMKEELLWETWEEKGTGKNQLGFTMEDLEYFNVHVNNLSYDTIRNTSFRTIFYDYFNM